MRVARRFVVTGRVQGVGYRMYAADVAAIEGLWGHVRNLDDGCVEVLAEGDAEALTRFEAALWRGPSRARITAIEIDETSPSGHTGHFTIQ